MDQDILTKVSASGAIILAALRVAYVWIKRDKQDSSLYAIEVRAHRSTRSELERERQLRKDTEMELSRTRKDHELDRETWLRERTADRDVINALKTQVFELELSVKAMTNSLQSHGIPINNS